jgi:hypothetical protein
VVLSDEQEKEMALRFTYHAPKADQPQRYEALRALARAFATGVVAMCPPSREQSNALTKIEEGVMWANAGIARNE